MDVKHRCVCGKTFHTYEDFREHSNYLRGVHEEAGPDEDTADTAQASPDAPGDAQAPVPDQMPETAPAEAQSADESVGVPAQDFRIEAIRAWAMAAAKALYPEGSHIAYAEGDDVLDRIIKLAGDR